MKKCKICGTKGTVVPALSLEGKGKKFYFVSCEYYHFSMDCNKRKDAIKAWNELNSKEKV